MSLARRRRGSETQNIVAEWFRTNGWEYADSDWLTGAVGG